MLPSPQPSDNAPASSPSTTPKKFSSTAGPRQTKAVTEAINSMSWTAKGYIELHGVRGKPETELRSVLTPLVTGSVQPAYFEKFNAIGEKFNWLITVANHREVLAAVKQATAELEASMPVHDMRITPTELDAIKTEQQLRRMKADETHARHAAVNAAIMAKKPANAQAVIVAELEQDECDSMTDYFATSTKRRVVIGWRTGTREDFKQLRKAAATFSETKHLGPGCEMFYWIDADRQFISSSGLSSTRGNRTLFATVLDAESFKKMHVEQSTPGADTWTLEHESIEHRDNYSMGKGNYLKAGSCCSSGWIVKSESLNLGNSYEYEDGLPVADDKPTTDDTAPATTATAATGNGYVIEEIFHSKRQVKVWLVVPDVRTDGETYQANLVAARELSGWYSAPYKKQKGGFMFTSLENAQRFAVDRIAPKPAEAFTEAPARSTPPVDEPSTAGVPVSGNSYRVFIPGGQGSSCRTVTYPATGHPLFTREEAAKMLADWYAKNPTAEGDQFEPWAEGPSERFTHLMRIRDRLEYIRSELRAERISYEELAELQSLASYIPPDDTDLLEAAGVPENPVTVDRPVPSVGFTHPLPLGMNEVVAIKLEVLALGMQAEIDCKQATRQENTLKRQCEAMRMRLEAGNLERGQRALRALAAAHRSGTVPNCLAKLQTKKAIVPMVRHGIKSNSYYHVASTCAYEDKSIEATTLQVLMEQHDPTIRTTEQGNNNKHELAQLLGKVRFADIPGFFPTKAEQVVHMVKTADIVEWNTVLEPSAGIGSIAEAIRDDVSNITLDCIEINSDLCNILTLKGFKAIHGDFLLLLPEPDETLYDRIIMNPPFENGQDMQHVCHAFDYWLKKGGRLVSLMSTSPFNNQSSKFAKFRHWFAQVGGVCRPLPAGAFKGKDAFRETSVNAVMVVIDK